MRDRTSLKLVIAGPGEIGEADGVGAKQFSNFKARLDRFVASLLAMTAENISRTPQQR